MGDNLREDIRAYASSIRIGTWLCQMLDRIECLEGSMRSHDGLLSETPNGPELADALRRIEALENTHVDRMQTVVYIVAGAPAPAGYEFVTMKGHHYEQWRRELEREIAELTADEARIDWMESLSPYSAGYTAWKIRDGQLVRSITTEYTHETVREAIDAARKEGKP